MKGQNLLKEDWDNLIILDGCRYDFFAKVYKDYLDGKLEKRKSPGSCTGEWLVKTFPGSYDITYISANPYINSYGIPLKKCNPKYSYSWKATEHFRKIIDVWKFGWDENLETVHPERVNKAYLSNQHGNRMIIHYMQPHPPYLSLNFPLRSWKGPKNRISGKKERKQESQDYALFSSVRNRLTPGLRKILGEKGIWQIRRLFLRQPMGIREWLWREGDVEKIYYYYEDNLRQVLKAVSQLLEELHGKIVITADHGEAFGEQEVWGHPKKTHIPVLVEVPWLEVRK